MVGRSADRSIVVSGTSARPDLRPLVGAAAARSAVRVHLGHDRPWYRSGLVEDWSGSSDHGAFRDRGIPYLYLGVEDHEDYHAPGDTVDKIDPSFFLQVAELTRDLAEALDRAPGGIPR
jgi:Zn-dependent M28 family amino/carboxypeptidase